MISYEYVSSDDALKCAFGFFYTDVFMMDNSGRTLRDFLEALPREWISEDLMEALTNMGVHLSPTM